MYFYTVKIIQASTPHTGSTVLANCLTEIFDKGKPISCGINSLSHKNIVTKTHNIDFDYWTKKYKNEDLFFFVTHRKNHKKIDKHYMSWGNIVIFQYEEILETESYSVLSICTNIYNKVLSVIENINPESIKDMEARILEMNRVYDQIKDKPFEHYDEYFHIHGSHRGRAR